MGYVAKRLQTAWLRRFDFDDAVTTFVMNVPGTSVPSSTNPLQTVTTAATVVTYSKVRGGWWKPTPQDETTGLHVDMKQGRVVIPSSVENFNQLKSRLEIRGVTCFMDSEQVSVTMLQYDKLAQAIVLDVRRVEG